METNNQENIFSSEVNMSGIKAIRTDEIQAKSHRIFRYKLYIVACVIVYGISCAGIGEALAIQPIVYAPVSFVSACLVWFGLVIIVSLHSTAFKFRTPIGDFELDGDYWWQKLSDNGIQNLSGIARKGIPEVTEYIKQVNHQGREFIGMDFIICEKIMLTQLDKAEYQDEESNKALEQLRAI